MKDAERIEMLEYDKKLYRQQIDQLIRRNKEKLK